MDQVVLESQLVVDRGHRQSSGETCQNSLLERVEVSAVLLVTETVEVRIPSEYVK